MPVIEVEQWKDRPFQRTGGPPDNGGMEARVAKLEAAVEHIQSDIKDIKVDVRELRSNARTDFILTWVGMIVGFLGIAGLLARGFKWF